MNQSYKLSLKSNAGSQETLQALNNEPYKSNHHDIESNMAGSEKDRKVIKISRKARGKNIMFHSDCEEELQSVKSDNPYMYARSMSSVRCFRFFLIFTSKLFRTPLTTPALRSTCFNQEERHL